MSTDRHLQPPPFASSSSSDQTHDDKALTPDSKPTSATSTPTLRHLQEQEKQLDSKALDHVVELEAATTDNKAEREDVENSLAIKGEPSESLVLHGWKLFGVFSSLLLSCFLIFIDMTIVATALPVIASDFDSLDQITWIVSVYFMTQAPFVLVYGQILTIFPTKWVYIVAVVLFEIGSLICGVAPSAEVLIFGRAFAGVGAAGIFVAVLSIFAEITTLEDRPKLMGAFGALFAVASVVGPLLGGAFTDHVTWRWCFYINLPVGAVSIGALLFMLKAHQPPGIVPRGQEGYLSPYKKVAKLDWIGAILILGVTTCLILPLQEGGIRRPWNSGSIISEFVVFGILVIAFVGWEYYIGRERALLPLHLLARRGIVGACIATFFLMFIMLAGTYYLPLFYQAVKEHSATKSGIDILAFMLSLVIGSMGAGIAISITGHYYYFLVAGPLITPIGAGLFWTITQYTSTSKLVGYQILLGAGAGLAMQNPLLAVQAELHNELDLIPVGTALATFFQLIGGVLGLSVCGTLFNNQLATELANLGVERTIIDSVKVTVEAIFDLEGDLKVQVLTGYVRALRAVFITAVPAAILASIFSAIIKPLNLKKIGGLEALGAAA